MGDDKGHIRQRLDIVDRGRLAEQSDLDRKRRLDARLAAFAFDGLEQRGLFAALVRACAASDFEVKGKIAAQNFFAEQIICARGVERIAHARIGERVLTANVNVTIGRADRARGEQNPFEYLKGIAFEQHTVFEGARF